VEERAQLLAVTDPLTGLGNYRSLLQVLDTEVRSSIAPAGHSSVLLLDLDELNNRRPLSGSTPGVVRDEE